MATKPSAKWRETIRRLKLRHAEALSQGEQPPPLADHESIRHDHLICLDCRKAFRSLRRHIEQVHGVTPGAYREKWALPANYPMEPPAYYLPELEFCRQELDGLGLLFPEPFVDYIDSVLDDYLVTLHAIEVRPEAFPALFNAIEQAVLRLNGARAFGQIETSVRGELCDFFRDSVQQRGFDLEDLYRWRGVTFDDVVLEWRDW